MTQLTSKW